MAKPQAPQVAGTIDDICQMFKVGPTLVHREIKLGHLRAFKVGRATRIYFSDAHAWFGSRQREPANVQQ